MTFSLSHVLTVKLLFQVLFQSGTDILLRSLVTSSHPLLIPLPKPSLAADGRRCHGQASVLSLFAVQQLQQALHPVFVAARATGPPTFNRQELCVFIPLEATSVFSSVHETQFSNVGNSSWPWNSVPDTGCSPFVTFHLRFTMSLMKSCCHKYP